MEAKKGSKVFKFLKVCLSIGVSVFNVTLLALSVNIYCNDTGKQESYVEVLKDVYSEAYSNIVNLLSKQKTSKETKVTEYKEKTIVTKDNTSSEKKKQNKGKQVATNMNKKHSDKKESISTISSESSKDIGTEDLGAPSEDSSLPKNLDDQQLIDSDNQQLTNFGNQQTLDSENYKLTNNENQQQTDSNSQQLTDLDRQQSTEPPLENTHTVNVDIQSQLVFLSNDTIKEGTVTLYFRSNTEFGEEISDSDTYNVEDIVNFTNEKNDTLAYIEVNQGIYNIEFNTSVEINVQLVDDIDEFMEYYSDELETNQQDNQNGLCLNETKTVVFDYDESMYSEDFYIDSNFIPIISFYSEGNIDGNLELLDQDQNVLMSTNITDLDAETHQKTCDFELLQGSRYTVRINPVQSEPGEMQVYYYSISESNQQ